MTTKIDRKIGRGPKKCPRCGSIDLVIATDPSFRVEVTDLRPAPKVRWIGYDCQVCGEDLRF